MVHQINTQESSLPTVGDLAKKAVESYREYPLLGFERAAGEALAHYGRFAHGQKGTADYDLRKLIMEKAEAIISVEKAAQKTREDGKKFAWKYRRSAAINALRSPRDD